MRLIAALTVAAFVAGFCSSSASAANVRRSCNADTCDMTFDGAIKPGDAEAVERAIRTSPRPVSDMTVASPGGDAFEALKISSVLNTYFVQLIAGYRDGHGDRIAGIGGDCTSACALMFLTADQRSGTEIFLQRPDAAQATNANPPAEDTLLAQLNAHGVPNSLVALMIATPPGTTQKLAPLYPVRSLSMKKWLASKCGDGKGASGVSTVAATSDTASLFDTSDADDTCEADAIRTAQIGAQMGR